MYIRWPQKRHSSLAAYNVCSSQKFSSQIFMHINWMWCTHEYNISLKLLCIYDLEIVTSLWKIPYAPLMERTTYALLQSHNFNTWNPPLKSELVLTKPQLTLGNSHWSDHWQRLTVYREFSDSELCGKVGKNALFNSRPASIRNLTTGLQRYCVAVPSWHDHPWWSIWKCRQWVIVSNLSSPTH